MKLFKKLIPLATIAGVGMGVVPLATSCSTKLPEGWVDGKASLDTSGFTIHTGDYSSTTTPDEFADEYLKLNTKVMNDDFAYFLTQVYEDSNVLKLNMGKKFRINEFNFKKLQGKLSNFKVEDATKHTASYTIEYKVDVDMSFIIDDLIAYLYRQHTIQEKFEFGNIKFKLELDGKFVYNKVPITITHDYVRSAQDILGLMKSWWKGLSIILDTSKMVKQEYSDWKLDAQFTTKGFVSNDDLYVDLGLDMSKDTTLKITYKDLILLEDMDTTVRNILMLLFGIFGGWSTYYYSNYEHHGKL